MDLSGYRHRLTMTSAAGLFGGHAHFLHWGVVQISLANFVVIVLMVVVFVLRLVGPFPHSRFGDEAAGATITPMTRVRSPRSRSWTVGCASTGAHGSRRPIAPRPPTAYVQSWIYVFGVLRSPRWLGGGSGPVLAVKGATWWHTYSVGHFVNSTHLWSVELFFGSWWSTCGASSSWPPGAVTGP